MPVVTSCRLSILNRDKEIMVLTSEFCKYNFGGQKWPVRPKIQEDLVEADASTVKRLDRGGGPIGHKLDERMKSSGDLRVRFFWKVICKCGRFISFQSSSLEVMLSLEF